MTGPADPPFAPEPRPDPSRRYPLLHLASIVLIIGGAAGALVVVAANPWAMDISLPRPDPARAADVLAAFALSGLAIVLGVALHVGRAVVVRQELPPERYRGPSVIVLLLLASIVAGVGSLAVAPDVLDLSEGRAPSIFGSLVILTVTQAAMLGVATLFVATPRALAGLRLLPSRGLWRTIGLGVVLALPAWIGAQLVAFIVMRLLEPFGLRPEEALAETAINAVDPVVLVIALVVVAPVAEETFFRGVVYNAWLREYGPRRAVIGSAVLFALIHGSIFVIPSILGLGIALALLYRWTGSLPASMAMHGTFNGITLLLGLLVRYNVIQLP